MSGLGHPARLPEVVSSVWRHPSNQGRRVRQLALMTSFQARARLLGRPTVVPLGERSRMLASLDQAASVQVAFANPPDYENWRIWRRAIKRGERFYDVGANVGTYSILMAELGAVVDAFEPDPSAVAALRANLSLNGYRVDIHEVALSSDVGQQRFTTGLDTMNHLAGPGEDGTGTVAVPTLTLDDVLGDGALAGLKVDVEGAEGQVLRGAQVALKEGRIRLLQLEWNLMSRVVFGEARDVQRELLADAGYVICRPADGQLVPDAGEEGPADVFAARPRTVRELNAR